MAQHQRLCSRCSTLDIAALLERHASTAFDEELSVWSWNDYDDPDWLKPDDCAFCHLVGVIKVPHDTSQAELWYVSPPDYLYILPSGQCRQPIPLGLKKEVRRNPSNPSKLWRDGAGRTCRTWTLFLASRGSVEGQGQLVVRKVDTHRIDFDIVKTWLARDESHRWGVAAATNPGIPDRLIDCQTKTVVAARDQRYLALSYVWGQAMFEYEEAYPEDDGELPQHLPATVADAITAAGKLGYRYLWCDKYCIDQDDEPSKVHQIQNMDIIFKGADATLVAAAGQGADFGLPGVNARPRNEQRSARLAEFDLTIISATSVVQDGIRNSKWNSRAWTYQEARLSSRLLVFTSDELYYESRAGNRRESVEAPFPCLDENLFVYQKPLFDPWNASNPEFVNKAIAEYSSRDLSREEDALIAALGFLKEFRNGPNPVFHHWGVPIFPDQAIRLGHGRKSFAYLGPGPSAPFSHEGFLLGLCWRPEGDPLSGNVGMKLHRRPNLPSWSWAGWTCELDEEPQTVYDIQQFHARPDDEVFLESDEGNLVPLHRLYEYRASGAESAARRPFSHFIHLKIRTVTCRLKTISREGMPEAARDQYPEPFALTCDEVDFPFCYGGWGRRSDSFISLVPAEDLWKRSLEASASLHGAHLQPPSPLLIGIMVGRFEDKTDWPYGKQFILVVCQSRDGNFYERVGYIIQGDRRVNLEVRSLLDKKLKIERIRIG